MNLFTYIFHLPESSSLRISAKRMLVTDRGKSFTTGLISFLFCSSLPLSSKTRHKTVKFGCSLYLSFFLKITESAFNVFLIQ